jgi:colanic acid biosynthesis glycosyl transferase WcaI
MGIGQRGRRGGCRFVMRILMLAGNYAPEETASAPLNTDVCNYLAAAGHSVSVVTTFPHYPQWKVRKEYAGRFYLHEMAGNVSVRRVLNYIPKRPSSFKRVLYYSSFAGAAFPGALASGRPDLVLCVTPPLELALSAYALQLLWRVPFVLWIKDLVPDIAIQLGMLKNPLAIFLARTLEKFAYHRASKLLVLSEAFAENISGKAVAGKKINVLSDWVADESIRPDVSGESFRENNGIDRDAFVVLHAGNIGDKQRLELLIQAAKRLEGQGDIQFVIIGDGARKPAVVAEAMNLRAGNVRFLPLQPPELLPQMLASADVLVLHQHAGVTDSVVPSKLLTYLATGKPIVATAAPGSGTRRLMQRAACGLVVEPENPAAFAEAILRLYEDRKLSARCGASGRAFADKHFSREVVLSRLESLLYEAAGISRPEPRPERPATRATVVAMAPGGGARPLA